MREITTHQNNDVNTALRLVVVTEPSHYRVSVTDHFGTEIADCDLKFQSVPQSEGVNGITNEVLLAIIIDRLACFQSGPLACRENALALTKLEEAVHWLHPPTRERQGG